MSKSNKAATYLENFWFRMRNRLRFGLATQEILDRLARVGLVVYPYVVIHEPIIARPQLGPLPAGLQIRQLRSDDACLVASVPERPRNMSNLLELMKTASCVAIIADGELLAYSWFTRSRFRGLAGSNSLCQLPADWAYLFDMYVRPAARGHALAMHLRHRVQSMLARQGVKHCCSVSLMFNRSARRFKYKLGATDVERRLLLRIKPFRGVDIRLSRKAWDLQTARVKAIFASK